MEMKPAADDIYSESVRARHVFLLEKRQTVLSRIPSDNDAMARCRFFFEQFNQKFQLIATKMLSPAIAVGHGYNIVWIGKIIPNLGVLPQEIFRFSRAGNEPSLFSDKRFHRNFAKSEKGETVFFQISREVEAGNSFSFISGTLAAGLFAFVHFFNAKRHYVAHHFLIDFVKLCHGNV